MKDGETCRWCRFFLESGDVSYEGQGYCHRYAPSPKLFDCWIDRTAVWPLVGTSDFCGEWEEKEGEGYKALVGGAE